MVPESFHNFYIAAGQVAGALIGLLFVAVQLSPDKAIGRGASVVQQFKVSVAFSALTNTLFVSLIALLPGTNLALGSIILAVLGLSSMVGLVVLGIRERGWRALRPGPLVLPVILAAVFGDQVHNGFQLLGSPHDTSAVSGQAFLMLAFFGIAIARAWDLLGGPASGLVGTVRTVIQERASRQADEQPATGKGLAGADGEER
jgi:hypothetical protein